MTVLSHGSPVGIPSSWGKGKQWTSAVAHRQHRHTGWWTAAVQTYLQLCDTTTAAGHVSIHMVAKLSCRR